MATITRAILAKAVLKNLGIIGIGVTPSAEDSADVIDRIDSYHAQLRDDGMAYWSDDEIPLEVREPLTVLLAGVCAPMFQVSTEKQTILAQQIPNARKALGKHVQARRALRPNVAEFF